ncbi:cancer/testis antigen 1 [Fukomys damarensis]|uniref:cancer/testis antigen 1 n=1 Tax=Fukomys damarensis TaxID=885580 RepID=UPI00053F413F|nr:cancer/testis antigen 1 [Fukomys damarensis]
MEGPANAEGGPEGHDGDNRVGGGPAYPTFVGGQEGAGEECANGREHPQGEGAVQGPVPGGDASAGVTEQKPLELHLTVPFCYSLDAEIAYLHLSPVAGSLPEGVHMEITVDGKVLNILLIAENSHLLEICISALLHQLCTVIPVFGNYQT